MERNSKFVLIPLAIIYFCFLSANISIAAEPVIVSSFQGNIYNGWYPPDTMGAVGPSHCVEMINSALTVYNKTGTQIQTQSLNTFWAAQRTGNAFDPRIVYDKYAGRWYAISADNPKNVNHILFAYTDGSDPTGTWHKTAIDSDPTDARWADFPTLGFDQNGVYIAANMFAISSGSSAVSVFAIPKVGGVPDISHINTFYNQDPNSYGYSIAPTNDYDPTDSSRPYYLVSRYNNSYLKLSKITWSGTSATLSTGDFVSTTYYGPPSNARQPGSDDNIDTGDGRIVNAVVQNGKLWAVRGIEINGNAGANWYKVNIPTSGSASIDDENALVDAGSDLYYASIAVNEAGDIGFGFTHSSDSEYASAYISGIDDGISLDMLEYKSGEASYLRKDSSDRNRWGDYSMTMVDPLDDNLFWSIQEYAESGGSKWGTYWVSFRVPEPATVAFLLIPLIGFSIFRRRKKFF